MMKSNLKFNDYVINNIEFRNNLSFQEVDGGVELDFDIDSGTEFVDEKKFILGLQVEVFRQAEDNNYPFNFKVEVLGTFEIDSVDPVEKENLAEKNSVAILFPYVRALITTFTSASNVQPIILPPINVVKYLESKRNMNKK